MTAFYDARGNLYGVVAPEAVRRLGIALPASAAEAALARANWSEQAIEALCSWPSGTRPEGAKAHRSDGLLVGPFQDAPPFDLLIVNTDGTLAERSGNGLTIFSQALTEQGLLPAQGLRSCGCITTSRTGCRRWRPWSSRRRSPGCPVSGWTSGNRRSAHTPWVRNTG